MTSISSNGQRRVRVFFPEHGLSLDYQADVATAENFSAAFAGSANPVVTLDEETVPGLRPLPCARLYQLRSGRC
jgi:hypothetical protein